MSRPRCPSLSFDPGLSRCVVCGASRSARGPCDSCGFDPTEQEDAEDAEAELEDGHARDFNADGDEE